MSNLAIHGYQDYLIVQSAGNGEGGGGYSGVNSAYQGLVASTDYEHVYKEVLNEYSDSVQSLLKEKMECSPLTQWSFGDFFEERILVVGSIQNEKESGYYKMASDSNYGDGVDLCAPGEDVYSTIGSYYSSEQVEDSKFPGVKYRQYGEKSGTSMAAPIVSGAAALVWSINPDWSVETVRAFILDSCTEQAIDEDQGGVDGKKYKVLNVGNAVEVAVGEYQVEQAIAGNPEAQTEEEEIETESEPDAGDALQTYLDSVLVPQYGVMDTGYITGNYTNGGGDNWTSADVNGLLSGNIMDFDGDGQEELLTVRFEPDEENYPLTGRGEELILQMYEYRSASDSVELSAGKRMTTIGPCYSGNGIGYSQTGIFTFTYLGDTYIAVDSYHAANGYELTFSVFQYGGSGVNFDVVVPHTGVMEASDEKVQRDAESFIYVCGANFYLVSEGDYYVNAAYTEPEDPLSYDFFDDTWATLMEYQAFYTPEGSDVAESNDPITEEQKAEMIDCYRQRIEAIGLNMNDSRIDIAENSGYPTDESAISHATTPEVYTAQEGSITFLAGLYTYVPSRAAYNQATLERQDYEGTLDAYRP